MKGPYRPFKHMKKFIASIGFILAFSGYALYQNGAAQQVSAASTTPSAKVAVTKTVTVAAAPPPAKSIASAGAYRDGIYTGSQADAYYGTVQVQVKISGGKIADVTFLSYPSDRGTSRSINSYAMPQLTQEAISAQSANVNGVSGASDTSAAFRQSLSSALNQAA